MKDVVHKVLRLVQGRDRWWLYVVAVTTVVRSLVEVAGVASIMPFLSIVSDPETIHTNTYLSWIYEAFGFSSDRQFLLAVGFGVLFLLIFNNAFAAFALWLRQRFTARLKHGFSKRLLDRYLKRPYVFFLGRNSADLNKNILSEANSAVEVLSAMLEIGARTIVALAILGLLFVVDWKLSLIVVVTLSVAYAVVWMFVRHRLSVIGEDRFAANQERYQISGEAFGGIKEVKLMGREDYYTNAFQEPSRRFNRHQATSSIISLVPKYALEAIAFGGILLIILYYLALGQGVQSILPIAGLFAFAGYRMMPALQSIYSSISKVRYNLPALDAVYEDLEQISRSSPGGEHSKVEPIPVRELFALQDVTFTYPGAAEPALRNVSLNVPVGHSIGLVGATGSGKTTTIDILLGLLRPDQGALVVDGRPIDDDRLPAWQAQLGYVPQDIYLTDDTIRRNIAFGVPDDEIDETSVRKAAAIANIADFIEQELPEEYDTEVGERGVRLSGGQRQRIGIARALYRDPAVLIFDEATSDLDNATERAIVEAIDRVSSDKTIVQIAHRLTTVEDCDTIYVLEQGRVVGQGTYTELLRTNEKFREMAQTEPVHN